MGWYVNILEGLGYRVVALPFKAFNIPLSEIHKSHEKSFNDAFYEEKNAWPSKDIVVTNTGNIVTLILLNPRFLKSFFSPDRQPHFSKATQNKIGFSLLFKNSLILN